MAGDLDRLAQTLKTMELDNGLTIDDEGARKIVEERPLPTLEEQLRIFGGEPGQTEADAIVMKYVDIFTEEGRISKEDRDALAESGFVDSSLLQEIAAGK
ncbi:MAG: hypothetical protein HFI31_03490 [Lachnospiraceae bacterium]|jgi:hypothetical protein|nr:hypothetical protein [Lachnospiraceae bacterium]MCI9133243.1 hypothetical protein [Lachnospiraceae bacterium]